MNTTLIKIIYILLLVVVFIAGYKLSTNEYTYYTECKCLLDESLLEDYYLHHDDFNDDFDGYIHIEGDHLHKNDHYHKH